MIAVKTKFFFKDLPEDLESIRAGIARRIPLNAGAKNQKIEGTALTRVKALDAKKKDYYDDTVKDWKNQLGTLGSGNHFIEVCLDEEDRVWLVLHSGSRGIGNRLADRHIKVAMKLMDTMHIKLPDRDLSYLPTGIDGFDDYIYDLLWSQDYARLNREEMMDRVLEEMSYALFGEGGHAKDIEIDRINCHHNFTQMENHFNKNMWITRKGAIQMNDGQLGVIPGSMGTKI